MGKVIHKNMGDFPEEHVHQHEEYEFFRRSVIPRDEVKQLSIAFYEIPPGKSAFPYHYHAKNEEAFYIISGRGVLRTPEGESEVSAGDILYFPADENGAHKLTNTSESENLVYLDIDTEHDLEVSFYPDSGKIGVWGEGLDRLYRFDDDVEYYSGE